MTKLDLGGWPTPKKITRFTVMFRDKIYLFFGLIPCQDLMGVCTHTGQTELLQRKLGVNYTIPTLTLTSYTEKLGKKCTIPA